MAVTRFVFRSRFLYDIDSVNFGLALDHFDPRVYQPHPPGYFLYLCLGRLMRWFVPDANLALVLLSLAASCGVVLLIDRLAREWFGPSAAHFATALYLLSPLAWFHGTVALTYGVEAFFSALVGYLCWKIIAGGQRLAWKRVLPCAILLGLAAGVRPSTLLFLGPMFLFSLVYVEWKERLLGISAVIASLAAWFLPMIHASGGWVAYRDALVSLWQLVPSKDAVWNSSPVTSFARALTILFLYLLFFGVASLAPLMTIRRAASNPLTTAQRAIAHRRVVLTLVWIVPGLSFFTFVFLRFVNSGYLLLVSAPACLWLGHWASRWYEETGWSTPLKRSLIAVWAAGSIAVYLASPFYFSWRSVRQFEAELDSVRQELPQIANPRETIIVGFDSHFLGYRHAGYYLPDYLTLQYPAVKLREGTRIFAMDGRDTHLLSALPSSPSATPSGSPDSRFTRPAATRFVLFPLPSQGGDFRQYEQQVTSRLPRQSLQMVHLGNHDYVTGPIADLPLLFPAVTSVTR